MTESGLPRNGQLLALAAEFPTNQALADHLGVPRTTLSDHIGRIGMRDAVQEVRSVASRTDDLPPVIVRDYSHLDTLYVYPFGDVHIGAKHHDRALWESWLDYLTNRKDTSMIGMGDFLNTAIIGAKSDVYDEQLTPGDAKRLLAQQLKPLADEGRLDGLMPGNHEDRITRSIGDCPIKDVAEQLKVNYIEAAAVFVYYVGTQAYTVYVRHGTGNGQSLSALKKSAAQTPGMDIYVTGHIHIQQNIKDNLLQLNWKKLKLERHKTYFVSSGSFLGLERYALQRGYAAGAKGAPRIRLDGKSWDTHVSF